jgi:hypothetical protein
MRIELGDILRFVARISIEILAFAELGRVDEETGNHQVAIAPRAVDKRKMTFMQRPHGWHKPDQLTLISVGLSGRTQFGDCAQNSQGI